MKPNFLQHLYPEFGQLLGGRYKLVEQLGSGGFGQTFMAQDRHLPGHPVCVVKQLNPQVKTSRELQVAERLFETEAQALYKLGCHPQIPRLLAHFDENREFYLVQEFIEGHSLDTEFATNTLWDDSQVIAFLDDILDTLAFIHEHRVIHRDLKPSNLMRRQNDNRIVVIDFGAVKQVSTQLSSSTSKISHTISIGTQGYMPNEQIAGRPHFSSDVYAVGMIALQALTGQHPSTIHPHLQTGELDWHELAPRCDPSLIRLLDCMLRYDFRSRYANAREALTALRSLSAELGYPKQPTNSAALDLNDSHEQPKALTFQQSDDWVEPPLPSSTVPTVPVDLRFLTTQTMESSVRPAIQSQQSRKLALPTGIGILLSLGFGILTWRACAPTPVGENVTTTSQKSSLNSASPKAKAAPAPVVEPTVKLSQNITYSSPAAETMSPVPATTPSKPQISEPSSKYQNAKENKSAALLTPELAQDTVDTFYRYVSNKDWDAAHSLFGGKLAQQFEPSFYRQFQRMTVENLRVIDESAEHVNLIGQNTYVYPDESIQQEERTYRVQMIDSHPYITESSFIQVIKARNN